MKKHFYILILFLALFSVRIYGQNFMFRHLDASLGLSCNTITSIYQDFRGFLWLGTPNGLNLYNGNECIPYKYDRCTSGGLPSNRIEQLVSDGGNNIYIRTDKGVVVYHIPTASFSTITTKPIQTLFWNQALYLVFENTIYRYGENRIEEIYRFSQARIKRLCIQNDSIFIGTTENGLYLYQQASKHLSHLIKEGEVFDIFCDSQNNYWVTDYAGGGLYLIKGKQIEHFTTSSYSGSISHNQTHCCCEDFNGDIWIGTFNGLNKYDYRTGRFTFYYRGEGSNSLNESSIWSLYCDRQGTVWAGTYYGGVNYFNPTRQVYQKFEYSRDDALGLSAPIVGEMTEDDEGNLWMCTEGGGVCCYSPTTGKFKRYMHGMGKNSLSHNHAKTLWYDSTTKNLWIGTHLGGLNKLEVKTGCITHYRHDKNDPYSVPSNIIRDITPCYNGLVLSTFNGVVIFNPSTGKCQPLFPDEKSRRRTQYALSTLIDHQDNLWVVPEGHGVLCYNFRTGKTSECLTPALAAEISDKKINSLFLDSMKKLWICTAENGLGVYHYDTDEYEEFGTYNGKLASNVIYAIRELSDGCYILTTDVGYSLLDYKKKEAVNIRIGKEIPLNAISRNSLYISSGGQVFIGGMDGVVSFSEKSLDLSQCDYGIYLSKLYINGEEVFSGDKHQAFDGELSMTECIVLRPECKTFILQYAVTNYLPYRKEKTEYRLIGLTDQWQSTHGNMISCSYLVPGTYILQIRVAHGTDKKITLCSMKIEVLPPFYRTGVAYFFYFLIGAGIVCGIMVWYKRKLTLQTALLYEQKHAEEVEKLAQNKLRFFIDISHEFHAPLTIILGQIEILLQQQTQGSYLYNSLMKTYRNCRQLDELITELLEFQKHEQGCMTIKVHRQDLVAFLQNHFQTFRTLAVKNKITYKFVKCEENIELWFDERMLWKVMNNLLSNSFKYTPEKGEIKVIVYQEGEEAVIEVRDNGEGIAPEDLEKVFDRFYRVRRNASCNDAGVGVGLSLTKGIVNLHHGHIDVRSKQGVETVFTVHLKRGCEHFTNNEKEEDVQTPIIYAEDIISKNLLISVKGNETTIPEIRNDEKEISSEDSFGKVLIVEDNHELLELLVTLFAPYYQVLEAKNGREAFELAKNELPDLIVSDIVMPELTGIQLCREMKQEINVCHIPIVLLTAKTDEASLFEGLKAGADDYVQKPFNPRLLLLRCNNLVNSHRRLLKKNSKSPKDIPLEPICNLQEKTFINRVTQLIREHMKKTEFGVDALVREVGISRTKFFKLLKEITGKTPGEFIQDVRLNEAARLLKDNLLLNVTDISEEVGFCSVQYFRKCFKEKYHLNPLEYRNSEVNS